MCEYFSKLIFKCITIFVTFPNFVVASENIETSHNMPINLLPLGSFHGDEVKYNSGGNWLALVTSGNKAALEPVKLKLNWVYDAVLDGDDKINSPYTGKRVTISPIYNAIVLLQGQKLKSGSVLLAKVKGRYEGLYPKDIELGNNRYTLALENCNYQAGSRCKWILRNGKLSQVIGSFEVIKENNELYTDSGSQTGLVWAGDLDRDGKLDLIVDVSTHYNSVSDLKLLLSSFAKNNNLFEVSAYFHAVGC